MTEVGVIRPALRRPKFARRATAEIGGAFVGYPTESTTSTTTPLERPGPRPMRWILHRLNSRGGVLLDLIVGLALVVLGAFVLASFGLNATEILRGARHFFGIG